MAAKENATILGSNVSRSKDLPWYQSKLGSSLTPAGRALLETYSGIPASEVEAHIYKNRDSAWEIFPWPCIGSFWFMALGLSLHPHYATLLTRLRTQDPATKFLDLGTCFGQDLRKLVADGAPPEALWGSDYFPEYEAAGHELFCDAERFQNRFIAGDLFDESPESGLVKMAGEWGVINIIMVLHIFDWDTQVCACGRVLKLLSRDKGSMVIGVTTGSTEAGDMVLKPPSVAEGEEKTIYRHNLDTFTRMWEEVGRNEGLELEMEVVYDGQPDRERREKEAQEEGKHRVFSGETQRRLFFTVTIV